MIWERDPLWDKARLFFQRALEQRADDCLFGLWSSLRLELLARAAVASVSPALLAEPDRDHKNLLHALGVGPGLTVPKSIVAAQVVAQCQILFPEFTREDATATSALINRRNAELHSAEAAFEAYHSKQWLPGFYHACLSLATALNETLETLLGPDEAQMAKEVLKQSKESVLGRVGAAVAAHRRVFDGRTQEDRQALSEAASKIATKLASERHHKVVCPACGSDATVEGDTFGPEKVTAENDDIVVRQSVSPKFFSCSACGLKLAGYAELDAAELGGTYARRSTFSPEEYYGLIDPDSADMSEYVSRYLADAAEYDNE